MMNFGVCPLAIYRDNNNSIQSSAMMLNRSDPFIIQIVLLFFELLYFKTFVVDSIAFDTFLYNSSMLGVGMNIILSDNVYIQF
jgi:hypothetical protein